MSNIKDDDYFQKVSSTLFRKFSKDNKGKDIARVKEILTFLAKGGHMFFSLPKISPYTLESRREIEKEWKNWKCFNKGYLRGSIKRLQKQRLVEINEEEGKQVVTITNNGKKKVLKYAIENISLQKPTVWDRKWRLVIYDIPAKKRALQNLVRKTLKRMEFYQIQESVYLTPYPCFEEIEFLRQYYFLEDEIKILIVSKLENDSIYRTYFGI